MGLLEYTAPMTNGSKRVLPWLWQAKSIAPALTEKSVREPPS